MFGKLGAYEYGNLFAEIILCVIHPFALYLPIGANNTLSGVIVLFIRYGDVMIEKGAENTDVFAHSGSRMSVRYWQRFFSLYLFSLNRSRQLWGKADNIIAPENIFNRRQFFFINKILACQCSAGIELFREHRIAGRFD